MRFGDVTGWRAMLCGQYVTGVKVDQYELASIILNFCLDNSGLEVADIKTRVQRMRATTWNVQAAASGTCAVAGGGEGSVAGPPGGSKRGAESEPRLRVV